MKKKRMKPYNYIYAMCCNVITGPCRATGTCCSVSAGPCRATGTCCNVRSGPCRATGMCCNVRSGPCRATGMCCNVSAGSCRATGMCCKVNTFINNAPGTPGKKIEGSNNRKYLLSKYYQGPDYGETVSCRCRRQQTKLNPGPGKMLLSSYAVTVCPWCRIRNKDPAGRNLNNIIVTGTPASGVNFHPSTVKKKMEHVSLKFITNEKGLYQ